MAIVDALIPSAQHLTGPHALNVLRAALAEVGGELVTARPCHVHYRPGREMAVRYETTVSWHGAPASTETLLAGTTRHGVPDGTLRVEGDDGTGTDLHVGVWRWPYDPDLPGLPTAVTRSLVGELVEGLIGPPTHVEVVAYRPTQRAVVVARDDRGGTVYVKALRPRELGGLAHRHDRLAASGVPVAEILCRDDDRGLLVFAALDGPTARERYQDSTGAWPSPGDYLGLMERFDQADLTELPVRRGRIDDAHGHAAMLARVAPDLTPRLEKLTQALHDAGLPDRGAPAVHGDLYEAQLVTSPDGGISGVLDLDDAGPGDPRDDMATVLAHLWMRTRRGYQGSERLAVHLESLRRAFAGRVEAWELDVATAAVLVGLATGPFRAQERRWRRSTTAVLTRARRLITHAGERTLIPSP
ncbi:MAG: aminoglycoside phosphotransferase family protein [Desertimonas sp.]